jgi:septal ring factor EnvC (AmiA/AmiB activator)
MIKSKYYDKYIYPYLLFLGLGLLPGLGAGNAPHLSQAQNNLSQLSKKITTIKTHLIEDQKQHETLQKEIKSSEHALQENQQQLNALKHKIQTLQHQMRQIEEQIQIKQNNVLNAQKLIFQHLKIHQKLQQESYWEVVFGAKNPFEYYQRIELYEYLYHSEQKQMIELIQAKKDLIKERDLFKNKQKQLTLLQKQLVSKQSNILQQKAQHQNHLKLVSQDINKNKTDLQQAVKNQESLKKLIQSLLRENTLQSHRPFSTMRKKLNLPILKDYQKVEKAQNGLIFSTPEHTNVYAVSAGKVVFSDWLNGYGYLVIVDHGWGFMTLYGNNAILMKKKGQNVAQGEVIASTGSSGSFHRTGLYFEIRQRAKVISANAWFKQKII